jgi:uncharacterized RDD family membrane protein YckC
VIGARRASELRVRTPEGIAFSLPLAGPATRMLAWAVDGACVSAASLVLQQVLGVLVFPWSPGLAQAVFLLAYFALSVGYGIALEWGWRGQTLGKRLLGLRVMDEHALRLQPSQVVVRNLLRPVDALPGLYLVGGLACLLSRRAQRLGDYAANTVVVRVAAVEEPDLEPVLAGTYNSFRDHPHLAARLRQKVTPAEATLALRALVRRERLEPLARVELFRELARHFRALVRFPEEATLALTDEQYLRNVVDVCFRARGREGVPGARYA